MRRSTSGTGIHIPPGADPPHRSRLAHQALDLLQGEGGHFLTQRPTRQGLGPRLRWRASSVLVL